MIKEIQVKIYVNENDNWMTLTNISKQVTFTDKQVASNHHASCKSRSSFVNRWEKGERSDREGSPPFKYPRIEGNNTC